MKRLSLVVVLLCTTTAGCKSRSRSQEHREGPAPVALEPAIKVMQRPSATLQLRPVDPAAARAVLPLSPPARLVGEPTPSANGAQLITVLCYDELEPAEATAALEGALTELGWQGLSLRQHPSRPEAALSGEREALRLTARIEPGSAQQCGDAPAGSFAELTLHQVLTNAGPPAPPDAAAD